MSATNRGAVRKERDFYPTPKGRRLLAMEKPTRKTMRGFIGVFGIEG